MTPEPQRLTHAQKTSLEHVCKASDALHNARYHVGKALQSGEPQEPALNAALAAIDAAWTALDESPLYT